MSLLGNTIKYMTFFLEFGATLLLKKMYKGFQIKSS